MKVQLETTTKAKQLREVNICLLLLQTCSCYPIRVCQVDVNSL